MYGCCRWPAFLVGLAEAREPPTARRTWQERCLLPWLEVQGIQATHPMGFALGPRQAVIGALAGLQLHSQPLQQGMCEGVDAAAQRCRRLAAGCPHSASVRGPRASWSLLCSSPVLKSAAVVPAHGDGLCSAHWLLTVWTAACLCSQPAELPGTDCVLEQEAGCPAAWSCSPAAWS